MNVLIYFMTFSDRSSPATGLISTEIYHGNSKKVCYTIVIIIPKFSLSLSKQLVYFWHLMDVRVRDQSKLVQSSKRPTSSVMKPQQIMSQKLQ